MNKILSRINNVPEKPGCYLWKNNGEVIYVGKAKNLKKRMKSYFSTKTHSPKNVLLVSKIDDFEIMLTNTETESLLLEKNLIDNYKPRYNIKIKNSSTFPYLKITGKNKKEIKIVNEFKKDGSIYYGPFPSGMSSSNFKKLLINIFPFNECKNPNSNKPCMNYELGLCIGHCIKKVKEKDYQIYLDKIDHFFKKSTKEIRIQMKEQIKKYSEQLKFEQAKELNKLLEIVNIYEGYQKTNLINIEDSDYIGWVTNDGFISITIINYRYGRLMNMDNHIYEQFGNEMELVEYFVFNYYFDKMNDLPVYLQSKIDSDIRNEFKIPIKGDRKKILNLAKKNSIESFAQKLTAVKNEIDVEKKINQWLKNNLNIDSRHYYELADISTMQNEKSIGVVVAFNGDKENKSLYRRFNFEGIKNNDVGHMEELVFRHFKNKVENSDVLPSLFIVDGGIAQLRAAKKAINSLEIDYKNIISLVKNSKHKTESILTYEEEIINFKNKNVLNYFERMQNEVHRFAITSFTKYAKRK